MKDRLSVDWLRYNNNLYTFRDQIKQLHLLTQKDVNAVQLKELMLARNMKSKFNFVGIHSL